MPQRASRAWSESWKAWEQAQRDYECVRAELHQRRLDGEESIKTMHVEMSTANASLEAEVNILQHERQACREERRELSVALLQHRARTLRPITKHRYAMACRVRVNP